jgi:hypothetical protein
MIGIYPTIIVPVIIAITSDMTTISPAQIRKKYKHYASKNDGMENEFRNSHEKPPLDYSYVTY